MKTILVPLDLGDHSDQVLSALVEFARKEQTHVFLLHVVETLRDTPFEEMGDFYQPLEERSREALEEHQRSLSLKQLEVSADVRFGEKRTRDPRVRARERRRYDHDEHPCDR